MDIRVELWRGFMKESGKWIGLVMIWFGLSHAFAGCVDVVTGVDVCAGCSCLLIKSVCVHTGESC